LHRRRVARRADGGAVNVALDHHRQTADHLFDGVMNGLERVLGALLAALDFSNIARNRGDRRPRACVRRRRGLRVANLLDMRE
jgi:hypothetical protein